MLGQLLSVILFVTFFSRATTVHIQNEGAYAGRCYIAPLAYNEQGHLDRTPHGGLLETKELLDGQTADWTVPRVWPVFADSRQPDGCLVVQCISPQPAADANRGWFSAEYCYGDLPRGHRLECWYDAQQMALGCAVEGVAAIPLR